MCLPPPLLLIRPSPPAPRPALQVCIIGAGKMSKLLVKHMHSKGCTRMTILNRSLPRAEALAEEFPDVTFDIHLMGDLMKVRGGAGGVGGCGWTGWCSLWVGG